jgi:FMN reductase
MSRLSIVGISGNLARPSRTRALVDAILAEVEKRGLGITRSFDLVDAGPDVGASLSREGASERVDRILSAIENADVLIAASPVYKASYTGLFKHLFDLLDPKALEGRHVLLAATGGSDRHALVIEHQLRPLFSFFGAHILPVSIYAVNGDFENSEAPAPSIVPRIGRAVDQLADLTPHGSTASQNPAANRISLIQHVA